MIILLINVMLIVAVLSVADRNLKLDISLVAEGVSIFGLCISLVCYACEAPTLEEPKLFP